MSTSLYSEWIKIIGSHLSAKTVDVRIVRLEANEHLARTCTASQNVLDHVPWRSTGRSHHIDISDRMSGVYHEELRM